MTVSGVLVVDKPRGPSSAQTVGRVRRVLKVDRAGHAGTLDPMATGVLVLCAGEATKISTYLLTDDKRYVATARLGVATDTYDAQGQVTSRDSVPPVSESDIRQALCSLQGRIVQRPPAFSALKRAGQPLYARARRGEDVQAPERQVDVYSMELCSWDPPDLTFRVDCGKGTYVRSLAVDLAARLGTVAHLVALRRERAGIFGLENAVGWAVVEAGNRDELLSRLIEPCDALPALGLRWLDSTEVLAIRQGRPVPDLESAGPPQWRLVDGPTGHLVAVGERRQGQIWPVRVLRGPEE